MRISLWCSKHDQIIQGDPSWFPMGDGTYAFDTNDTFCPTADTNEKSDCFGDWEIRFHDESSGEHLQSVEHVKLEA